MGCDVHMYVEKRNEYGDWEAIKGINAEEIVYYEELRAKSIINDPTSSHTYFDNRIKELGQGSYKDWIYEGRNYSLFGILADVRNGVGFAGIRYGAGFNPISEPRGLPTNCSQEVLDEWEEWACIAHSESFHTLKDLVEYDWEQTTIHEGLIFLEDYEAFLENGIPESWHGNMIGRHTSILTQAEADNYLACPVPTQEDLQYYVAVKWSRKYHDSAGIFYTFSLEVLTELSDSENMDDIRIVFWFDN